MGDVALRKKGDVALCPHFLKSENSKKWGHRATSPFFQLRPPFPKEAIKAYTKEVGKFGYVYREPPLLAKSSLFHSFPPEPRSSLQQQGQQHGKENLRRKSFVPDNRN